MKKLSLPSAPVSQRQRVVRIVAIRRILAIAVVASLFLQIMPAVAQEGTTPPPENHFDADLSSTARSLTAPAALGDKTVTIQTGTSSRAITSASVLTPAELLAVSQILSTGQQTLQLGELGNAVGGNFSVSSISGQSVSNLLIPAGVSSINSLDNVSIAGNLTNLGVLSMHPASGLAAIISAANVFNGVGALITSTGSMQLSALGDIVNAGTIRASGDLTVVAGQSIMNALPASVTGMSPLMIAAGNLDLVTGTLINSGMLAAINGNINLASQVAGHINVNNAGGVLQAINGAINVRDVAFAGKYDFNLSGGDVVSRTFNIWSGTGSASIDAKEVTGLLNIYAGAANVLAHSTDLKLGTMALLGDPTYFNTNGSIQINSQIVTSGANLAIIAKGNVTSTSDGSIDTSANAGGNVVIISGAEFTVSPPGDGSHTTQGQGTGDTSSTLTITGGSATGGQLDLSSLSAFTTQATGSGTAGNVTLLAFSGTNSNAGTVMLPTTATIQTGANGGIGGNVSVIAGAMNGTGITAGAIDTRNSNSGTSNAFAGGAIVFSTSSPLIDGTMQVLNGNVITTNQINTGALQPTAVVLNGSLTTSTMPVIVMAGTDVTIGGTIATNAAPVVIAAGGDVSMSTGASITTGGAMTGSNVGPGNLVVLAGGNIMTLGNNVIETAGPASSSNGGGDVLMLAGVKSGGTLTKAFTNPVNEVINFQYSTNGTSFDGGLIDLSNLSSTLSTTAAQGKGGSVTLAAFGGSGSGTGTVTLGTNGITTAGAGSTSANGNVVIIAGAKNGTAITTGATIDTSNSKTGQAANGGGVYLTTAVPSIATEIQVSGQIQTGNNSFSTSGTLGNGAVQRASISIGGEVTTHAAPVLVVAGADVSFSGTMTTDGAPPNTGLGTQTTLLPGNVSIFAGGNVSIPSTSSSTIDTSTSTAGRAGGDVLLVSGAALTADLSLTLSTTMPPAAPVTSEVIDISVGITGVSGSGGSIDAPGLTAITTTGGPASGASAGEAGGHVQLIALSGSVTAPGVAIATGGTSGGGGTTAATINPNGDVTIFAGASSGTSVSIGSIDTTGSTAGGGNVTISTSQATAGLPFAYLLNQSCVPNCFHTTGAFSPAGLMQASAVVGGINAAGGSTTLAPTGDFQLLTATTSVSVSAGLNLTLGQSASAATTVTNSNNALPANGFELPTSTITLSAGGVMNFVGTSISIESNAVSNTNLGVDGGTISLTAQSFNIPSGSAVAIQAEATGGFNSSTGTGGNGGSVSITSTGTGSAATITVGQPSGGSQPPGNFTISAPGDSGGGNGGAVSIFSGANINIDPSALNAAPQPGSNSNPGAGSTADLSSGNGARIVLSASVASSNPKTSPCSSGCIFINGSLDASGAASQLNSGSGNPGGNGGSIEITVNSALAFNVGNAVSGTSPNGTASSGVLSANGNVADGALDTAAFGRGGTIKVTNLGSGGITVQAVGSNPSVPTATGGIEVQAADAADNFYPAGDGGRIVLSAPNGPVLSMAPLDASGGAASNTRGSGNGGTIEIYTNSKTAFVVGSSVTTNGVNNMLSADGNLTPSGWSPSGSTGDDITQNLGSGGTIIISNVGAGGIAIGGQNPAINLSVAAAAANATLETFAGDGGTVRLYAPAGTVTIAGNLDVSGGAASSATAGDAGDGGTIWITTSTKSFTVVGATSNVQGALSATGYSGGTVIVENLTGGITIGQGGIDAAAVATTTGNPNNIQFGGNGGVISLQAPNGNVSVQMGLDVSGSSATPPSGMQGALGPNVAGSGGSIFITSGSSTPFTIGASAMAPANGVQGTLVANGGKGIAGNGDGGTIAIVNLGKGGIVVNSDSNNLTVKAPSANEGVSAPSTVAAPGNGGNISLQSPSGPLVLNNNLDASGGAGGSDSANTYASGFAGSISITANNGGSTPFSVTAGQLKATGWNGGKITVVNLGSGGLKVDNSNTASLAINVQASDANAAVNQQDRSAGGPGGIVSLQAPNGPVLILGNLDVSGGSDCCSFGPTATTNTPPPVGPSPPLTSVTLLLPSTTGLFKGQFIEISGPTDNGNVTEIEQIQQVTASDIVIFNLFTTFTNVVNITAHSPGGDGGQIAIVSGSSTPFNIGSASTGKGGNGTTGTLSANGANGGSISVTNAGSGGILIPDPSKLTVTPANQGTHAAAGAGGSIYLSATGKGGHVYVNGNLSADGGTGTPAGPGGLIAITINSTNTAFNLGGAASGCTQNCNGVAGMLSASGSSGGSVGVHNMGKAGIVFDPSSILVTASGGSGGVIDLRAPANSATLTVSTAGTLSADATGVVDESHAGGTISLEAWSINPTGVALTLSARGPQSDGSGDGGTVVLLQRNPKSALQIGSDSNLVLDVDGTPDEALGGNIILSAAGGLNVMGDLTTCSLCSMPSGTIRMAVSSAGISSSGTVSTESLTLNTGAGDIDLGATDVLFLDVSSGGGMVVVNSMNDLSLRRASQTGSGLLSISAASITVDGTVSSAGTVVLLAADGAGDIVLNADVSGATGVIIDAINSIQGPGAIYAPANGIALLSGAGGITDVTTSTGRLTITVAGDGSTVVSVSNTGNLLLSLLDSTDLQSLSVTNRLGSITTSGPIDMAETVTLTNQRQTGPFDSYNITLGGVVGTGTTSSSVTIEAAGSVVQSSAGSIVAANSITLASQSGNAGTADTPLSINLVANVSAGTLSVTTVGGGAGYINNTATSGAALEGVSTAGDFQLTTSGGVTVNTGSTVISKFGAVTILNTSTGNITINGDIAANGGPTIIQNNNTSGTIAVADSVSISGYARLVDYQPSPGIQSLTGVALLSGPFPQPPSQGTIPASVVVNINGQQIGQLPATAPTVFFGPGVTISSGQSIVNANNGADVVFNGGSSAGTITLGNGAVLTANGVVQSISSLDLTSNSVVSTIQSLQSQANSGVTGQLIGGSGGATGGNVIFAPAVSLLNLAALNIPSKVTVQFSNFDSANPVVANIPQGASNNAIVNGTAQFTSTGSFTSTGAVFINSNSTASSTKGTVFLIGKSASLTSDGNLLVNAGGNVSIAGSLSAGAAGMLGLFAGGANLGTSATTPPGTISLTGTLSAGNTTNPGTIDIRSSGHITQSGGSITASTVAFSLGGMNPLAYPASRLSAVAVAADQLSLDAGSGASINIQERSGSNVGAITFLVGNSTLQLRQNSALSLAGASTGNLNITSSGGVTAVGDVACGFCTLTTPGLALSEGVVIAANNASGTITVQSAGKSNLSISGQNASLQANVGVIIFSGSSVSLDGVAVSTQSGILAVLANGALSLSDTFLQAGAISDSYSFGPLSPVDVAMPGSILLSGAQLTVSGGTSVGVVGGDLQMAARGGAMVIEGQFQTDGGNIIATASGNVTGSAPGFAANAIGTMATNSRGGGVEIGSGISGIVFSPTGAKSSKSALPSVLGMAPGTIPGSPLFLQPDGSVQPLGSDTVIDNTVNQTKGTGAVSPQLTPGGTLNLSTSAGASSPPALVVPPTAGAAPATLNLSGGAVSLLVGSKTSILLDGVSIDVSGYVPIAHYATAGPSLELDGEECGYSFDNKTRVANLFTEDTSRARILTRERVSGARADRSTGAARTAVTVGLRRGSVFMNPLRDAVIRTAWGEIHARKGSLLSIIVDAGELRVAVCSGPGHVRVVAGNRAIALGPGEEVVVSDHKLTDEERTRADGVGRRRFHTIGLDAGLHATVCDVSLAGMLSHCEHMQSLKNPHGTLERQIAGSIVRNAAALALVTSGYGRYEARPRPPRGSAPSCPYTPVRFIR